MNRFYCIILCATSLSLAACDADVMLPKNATAARVVITASNTTLLESLGDSVVLMPRVLDQHGKPVNGTRLRWSVAPAGVVEPDADGVYRATGNGRVVIVATVDPGKSGVQPSGYWAAPVADSIEVEVRQRPVRLSLGPVDTAFYTLGALRSIELQVTDARGNPMQAGPPAVTWHSADTRVATVDNAGVVRSIGEGIARISVAGEELTGSAIFTVSPNLPHTSCMVYMQRRQTRESCVTLDFVIRERETGR